MSENDLASVIPNINFIGPFISPPFLFAFLLVIHFHSSHIFMHHLLFIVSRHRVLLAFEFFSLLLLLWSRFFSDRLKILHAYQWMNARIWCVHSIDANAKIVEEWLQWMKNGLRNENGSTQISNKNGVLKIYAPYIQVDVVVSIIQIQIYVIRSHLNHILSAYACVFVFHFINISLMLTAVMVLLSTIKIQ